MDVETSDTRPSTGRTLPNWWWPTVTAAVGGFILLTFAYALVNSFSLRRDSGVFPRFISSLALALFLAYLIQVVVRFVRARRTGADAALEAAQAPAADDDDGGGWGVVQAYVVTGVFFLACWVVGFHLAVPAFVVVYLAVWGEVRNPIKLGATFVAFLLLIVVLYGYFMRTPWPASLLEELMGTSWQRILVPYVRPLLELVGL